MSLKNLLDLRYARGQVLDALWLHNEVHPGDPLEYDVLRRVLQSVYPNLQEKTFKGQLGFLQDMGLIEPVIDDDLPLELQEISAGVRLTRAGRAVVEGDAEVSGIVLIRTRG